MLKSFSVKNFRNLNIEKLELKKINLLIGPNNSGKSNLIKAMSFFPNILLSEKKDSAFHDEIRKNGLDDVLNRKVKKPGQVDMEWVVGEDGEKYADLCYKLKFQVGNAERYPRDFFISEEQLKYSEPAEGQQAPFRFINCHNEHAGEGLFSARNIKTGKAINIPLEVDVFETVFRQKDSLLESDRFRLDAYPNFKKALDTVETFFRHFFTYSSTNINFELIRDAIKIDTSSRYLKNDGSDFVNVLSNLEEKNDFLDKYTDIMQNLIPGLEKIKFVSSGDTKKFMQLRIDGQLFKLSEMSDGTIKALILGLLLWTPEKISILALDEPELNIHPAWLKEISKWVINTDSVKQIIISSHSPDFLNGFTEGFMSGDVGLFVFNLDEEQTIKQVTPELLEKRIREGWRIGYLYGAGEPILGGWPW